MCRRDSPVTHLAPLVGAQLDGRCGRAPPRPDELHNRNHTVGQIEVGHAGATHSCALKWRQFLARHTTVPESHLAAKLAKTPARPSPVARGPLCARRAGPAPMIGANQRRRQVHSAGRGPRPARRRHGAADIRRACCARAPLACATGRACTRARRPCAAFVVVGRPRRRQARQARRPLARPGGRIHTFKWHCAQPGQWRAR